MYSTENIETIFALNHNRYVCPHCESTEFEQRVLTEVKTLLIFEVSRKELKNFMLCKQCYKKVEFKDLIINQKQVKVEYKETGEKVTTYNDTRVVKGKIEDVVVTRTNRTHVLPKVEDEFLLAKTTLSIMYYAALWDDRIAFKNNDKVDFILNSYPQFLTELTALIDEFSLTEMPELEIQAINNFRESKSKFQSNDLNFILRHGASLFKNQYFIVKEVEDFFGKLFDILGVRQLEQASYLRQLIDSLYF
jgi:hypothetical protein